MPKFIANTLASKPDQRDIPFVPRNGIAVVFLALLLSLSNAAGGNDFELRPAVHPYLSADVIVVLKPSDNHALNSASSVSRGISGGVVATERGHLDRPIIVPPGMVVSSLRQGVGVKLLLKLSPDGLSYYVIGVFPADYVHGEKR